MRRVVITGMGAVTPVGNTAKEYWNSLIEGKLGIAPIAAFDTSDLAVKIAAEVKDFDPSGVLSKPEVRRSDRYSQYAMVAAAEAMEQSGLMGHIDPERLGVYVGSGIGGMQTFTAETEKLLTKGPARISPHFITSMIANMATGLIAIRFKAQGPSLPIVTACATSTNTVGEAFHAIAAGYADAIIAGGAEAAITPLAVAGFTNCMALSKNPDPTTACVPFDRRRDGFIMGEGGGILVLEEYEHAKARGAEMLAEICGYGNTNDAFHVTAPDDEAKGGARAIRLALSEAGIKSEDSLYINAHGTSTPLNDRTETLAIKKALGEEAARRAQISSTKSMTGHMLGAAGAVEAIAAINALRTGILPPTIGLAESDPDCDLDYIPGKARKAKVDYAISISLGFGGHNACIALKEVDQ